MTARRIVVGVDSSTQSCKVELRDIESGQLIASGSAPHPKTNPPQSEQHPNQWWSAFVLALEAARRGLRVGDEVIGISIAAQCHGLVPLNSRDEVIRPAKLWNDTTASLNISQIVERVGVDGFVARVGSLPTSAFTLGKIAWLAENEPENFAAMTHILLPHDYLTWRLTGVRVTDRSDATGTGYFDVGQEAYFADYLALIDPAKDWLAMLPRVLGPDEAAGAILPAVAYELGLSARVIVGAGGGDQQAAALGLGVQTGDVVYSLGTSGVVSTISADSVHDPAGLVNGVADMTNGFMPLVCTLNATKVTDTFARILGTDYATLSALALAAPDTTGPSLAAFLDGERSPNRPRASGLLTHLTSETTREEVARAAYEGVLFGLINGQRQIERCGIDTSGRVMVVGGGARSAAYTQLLSDALDRAVCTADVTEATARGACVQAAAVASGRRAAEVRDLWSPTTRISAEPRHLNRNPWEGYLQAVRSETFDVWPAQQEMSS